MKNLIKFSFLILIISLAGCSDDDDDKSYDVTGYWQQTYIGDYKRVMYFASYGTYGIFQETPSKKYVLLEKGNYKISDSKVILESTSYSYEINNNALHLTDSSNESYTLFRTQGPLPLSENIAKDMSEFDFYSISNEETKEIEVGNSHILYYVIESGNSENKQPTLNSTVNIEAEWEWTYYTGKEIPAENYGDAPLQSMSFNLGDADIPEGLRAGLLSMKVGDYWDIVIPYDLAYGAEGATKGSLYYGPYSMLIYRLKLTGIE